MRLVNSSTSQRTSRYQPRTGDVPAFEFNAGDAEILTHLWTHRYLTTKMLAVLTGRSLRTLWRRLRKLFDAGYLGRLPFRKGGSGRPSTVVHVLSGKGAAKVGEFVGERVTYTPLKSKNREYQLAHHLMVSHFRVALEAACRRSSDIELLGWREGAKIRRAVTIREGGRGEVRYPIAPDGFFGLRDKRRPEGRQRLYFFFEADRSTMSHATFQKKLKGYMHLWLQEKQSELYKIKAFRVLTVVEKTLSWQQEKGLDRLSGLIRDARSIDPKGRLGELFYFTTQKQIDLTRPEALLEPIWRTLSQGKGEQLRSIAA